MGTATPPDLGKVIRARREALGITRAQLAGMADCSFSSLSFIEQGAVPKRSQVIERALEALDAAEEAAGELAA